jgi:hypothetical protein
LLVRATDGAVPEHIVCDDGVAVTTGIGFTVITAVFELPTHELAVGVMLYVAVPAELPVAERDCAIVAPVDAKAPETPDWTTVQEKVVPVILLVRAIDEAAPEQIVCVAGVTVATGTGVTIIGTVMVVPLHELAVGVIE